MRALCERIKPFVSLVSAKAPYVRCLLPTVELSSGWACCRHMYVSDTQCCCDSKLHSVFDVAHPQCSTVACCTAL